MAKIEVKGTEITVYSHSEEDYICITDIARHKNAERTDGLIRNWIRNRNTIEFLGIWEMLNNQDFKPVEFDGFKKQAGILLIAENLGKVTVNKKNKSNGIAKCYTSLKERYENLMKIEVKNV